MMNTSHISAVSMFVIVALSGSAFAQQSQPPAAPPPSTETSTSPNQSSMQGPELDRQYQAALKKCDPLTGTDKQKCIDAAKKKFGQM